MICISKLLLVWHIFAWVKMKQDGFHINGWLRVILSYLKNPWEMHKHGSPHPSSDTDHNGTQEQGQLLYSAGAEQGQA